MSIRRASTVAIVLTIAIAGAEGTSARASGAGGWVVAGGGSCSCMNVYEESGRHQQLKEQLNVSVSGLAVDGGDLLYANQTLSDGSRGIAVYPPGSKMPSREIGVLGGLTTMAVRTDGTLFAGTEYGVLNEYPPGTALPSATIQIAYGYYGSIGPIAVDPVTGEVYVEFNVYDHIYYDIIFRVSSDLRTATAILSVPWLGPNYLTVDQQSDLIVGLRSGIGVYPKGHTSPSRFFGLRSPVRALAYDAATDKVYAASDAAHGISVYQYATGRLVDTITSGWGPDNLPSSIALDPARP